MGESAGAPAPPKICGLTVNRGRVPFALLHIMTTYLYRLSGFPGLSADRSGCASRAPGRSGIFCIFLILRAFRVTLSPPPLFRVCFSFCLSFTPYAGSIRRRKGRPYNSEDQRDEKHKTIDKTTLFSFSFGNALFFFDILLFSPFLFCSVCYIE